MPAYLEHLATAPFGNVALDVTLFYYLKGPFQILAIKEIQSAHQEQLVMLKSYTFR
jgi:hypothetical protein